MWRRRFCDKIPTKPEVPADAPLFLAHFVFLALSRRHLPPDAVRRLPLPPARRPLPPRVQDEIPPPPPAAGYVAALLDLQLWWPAGATDGELLLPE